MVPGHIKEDQGREGSRPKLSTQFLDCISHQRPSPSLSSGTCAVVPDFCSSSWGTHLSPGFAPRLGGDSQVLLGRFPEAKQSWGLGRRVGSQRRDCARPATRGGAPGDSPKGHTLSLAWPRPRPCALAARGGVCGFCSQLESETGMDTGEGIQA